MIVYSYDAYKITLGSWNYRGKFGTANVLTNKTLQDSSESLPKYILYNI